MILGLLFISLNYLLGYKILKYYILDEFDVRNNNIILLGAFLIGNVICGIFLYLLDIFFVKYFGNYYISFLFNFTIISFLIIWKFPKQNLFIDIYAELNIFFKDRIKLIISILFISYCVWLYYGSLTVGDGYVKTDAGWGDSLYHLSYVNLIKYSNNIPVEYPFFPNQAVHYHFMYDYLVGKFAYLGINPVHALNFFSISSLLVLLLLIYEFGVFYFKNKLVGVMGSFFLIFHSSLASLIWLVENFNTNIISKIVDSSPWFFIHMAELEGWGLFNHNVYREQKHFPFALAFLVLIIFTFFILRFMSKYKFYNSSKPFILIGILIGLMPYWHAVICFVSLVIIFFLALLEFRNKNFFINSIKLMAVASILAIPQLMSLKSGDTVLSDYPKVFFGYGAESSSLISIGVYYAKVLGVKIVLIISAFVFLKNYQRKEFLVFSVPLILANILQFGYILYDNNKLIICSLLFLNFLAAYSIICLYNLLKGKLKTRVVIVVPILLMFLCTFAGVLDFFSINNRKLISFPNENSELKAWIIKNTDPKDIFLTYHSMPFGESSVVTINFAGRKVYAVWNYIYPSVHTHSRTEITKKIYSMQEDNVQDITNLIKQENITYIVFDKLVRDAKDISYNEDLFKQNLRIVYQENDLSIYSLK